jgi:transcriptional regulator with XRE-family HTH domain
MATKKRKPIKDDFGSYLKYLRVKQGLTAKEVAKVLELAEKTVTNVENGYNNPPPPERLKLWLSAIGCRERFSEAMSFISATKTRRVITYRARDPANEHIDRLIDAYEDGTLKDADLNLLRLIAPSQYA